MNKRKTPIKWDLIFSLSSIVVGPLILILSSLIFTAGGGDYCDASYMLGESGTYSLARDAEFARMNNFIQIASIVAILLGVASLAHLFYTYKTQNITKLQVMFRVLLAFSMFMGYSLLFLGSNVDQISCQ